MALKRSRGGSRPLDFLRACPSLVACVCLALVVLITSAPPCGPCTSGAAARRRARPSAASRTRTRPHETDDEKKNLIRGGARTAARRVHVYPVAVTRDGS